MGMPKLQSRYFDITALAIAAALTAWLALTSPLAAKSPVDMITIEGEDLSGTIEITDTGSLYSFNPWIRQFIDWKRRQIKAPPTVKDTYEVSFHSNERGTILRPALFHRPVGRAGLHLHPRPRRTGGTASTSGTIITGDSDSWNPNGQWQHATPAWGMLMQRSIEKATSSRTASKGSPNALAWALALGSLVLVSGATVASLRLRRKPT